MPDSNNEEPVAPEESTPIKTSSLLVGSALITTDDRLPPASDELEWVDHFSIGVPSSSIRFRSQRLQVYTLDQAEQIVLERDSHDRKVIVKRIGTASCGMRALRVAYTLVSLLVLGFLVVFCFQVIAFLFLNMSAQGGKTISEPNIETSYLIAAIMSVPMFVAGFSGMLSIATIFVQDVWSGSTLYQQLAGVSITVMESICVTVYLGIPIATMAISLLVQTDNWWEITASVWVLCVLFLMVVFAFLVVWCEVTSCWELLRLAYPDQAPGQYAKLAVLTTQRMYYSGKRRQQYLVSGNTKRQTKTKQSLYTRGSLHLPRLFDRLDPPLPYHTPDEIRDILPFFTNFDWSLERIFCRNPNAQAAFVQRGPGALREAQVVCSLVCVSVGGLLACLLVAGFLTWMSVPVIGIVLFPLLLLVCCFLPIGLPWYRLYKLYRKPSNKKVTMLEEERGDDLQDETVFQIWERVRVTQPKDALCWALFVIFQGVFFWWPLLVLFIQNNCRIRIIFLLLGGFSFPRLYFGPIPILKHLGSLSELSLQPAKVATTTSTDSEAPVDDAECRHYMLQKKARIANIVGRINDHTTTRVWIHFFAMLMVFVAIFWWSAYLQFEDGFDYRVKFENGTNSFVNGFYYSRQPRLPYPTCRIWKDFESFGTSDGAGVQLMDISFLATMSFTAPNETNPLLDHWFGAGEPVVDEDEFVDEYRAQLEQDTPISFKLFSFPQHPGLGIISIRGSESLLDWSVDIQLWLGAALAQFVRALTPLGWIWTPILDDLVYLTNSVENSNLKEVSYYTTTTNFINDLHAGYGGGRFSELRVTGASLGGGLAIITGAQTNSSTVAFSGLNAMMSRHTFNPPITKEALDTHTFNWIPERDPIAAVDDPGMLHQHAQCRAPKNSIMGCHSMWRNLCEIMYQCGSNGRPILCWCVSKYGYPPPTQNGTLTWEEACPPEEEK